MLCPECGEVMGPGPLDVRRACDRDRAKSNAVASHRGPLASLIERLREHDESAGRDTAP